MEGKVYEIDMLEHVNDLKTREAFSSRYANASSNMFFAYGSDWSIPTRHLIPKDKSRTKMREIFIFPDVDSHLMKHISNVLTDKFDSLIHPNVFSYRRNLKRLDACAHITSNVKDKWGFKVDITDYFGSVNRDRIKEKINSLPLTEESKLLITSVFDINRYIERSTGEVITRDMGLMQGSALSGFISNLFLYEVDAMMSSISARYARYSDDMLCLFNTEEEMEIGLSSLTGALVELGLTLNPKKTTFYKPNEIITFLGLDIDPVTGTIDISEKNFKELKMVIKTTCKRTLTKKKPASLKRLVDSINQLLYGVSSSRTSKFGSAVSLFQNVNTDETIKKLDIYIVDTVRATMTGRYNSGNKLKYPLLTLRDAGLLSMYEMFHTYLREPEAYHTIICNLNKRKLPIVPHSHFTDKSIEDIYVSYLQCLFVEPEYNKTAIATKSTLTTVAPELDEFRNFRAERNTKLIVLHKIHEHVLATQSPNLNVFGKNFFVYGDREIKMCIPFR